MADHLLEIADRILQDRHPIAFAELWNLVSEEAHLDASSKSSKISRFFTNLSFDGRFFNLGGNVWDLKSRYKFENYHVDSDDYAEEDDDISDDDDDLEETTFARPKVENNKDDSDEDSSEEENEEKQVLNVRTNYS